MRKHPFKHRVREYKKKGREKVYTVQAYTRGSGEAPQLADPSIGLTPINIQTQNLDFDSQVMRIDNNAELLLSELREKGFLVEGTYGKPGTEPYNISFSIIFYASPNNMASLKIKLKRLTKENPVQITVSDKGSFNLKAFGKTEADIKNTHEKILNIIKELPDINLDDAIEIKNTYYNNKIQNTTT